MSNLKARLVDTKGYPIAIYEATRSSEASVAGEIFTVKL